MRMIPKEFNGFLFQDAPNNVASTFPEEDPNDWNILGISTSNIARSNNFPNFGSKDYTGQLKTITVNLGNIDTRRDPLVIAMDVLGDEEHQLQANDQFGNTWYVDAVCVGLSQESIEGNVGAFTYVLAVADPIWKKLVPSTETISVNGTGSGTITPIGNQPALPIIEITPIGGGELGFSYKRFIQIVNTSPNALISYPLNIAGTVLNTAALVADNSNKCLVNVGGGIDAVVTTIPYDNVTGTMPPYGIAYCGTEQFSYTGKTGTTSGNLTGCVRGINGTTAAVHADNAIIYHSKLMANGDDLRVYVNSVEVKRWFDGFNTTTTKIWINWNQPANSNMTLGATIAGTGDVGTIIIENTAGNVALLPTVPTSGNVLIGSELFVYTGVNVGGLQLTGCTRASHQTSAGAHAVGDSVKFVNNDLYLYYGNPSIAPYVVDDTNKPIIKLTSTNALHVYEEFKTNSALRTAEWMQLISQTSLGFYPTSQLGGATPGDTNLVLSDPWAVMGLGAQPKKRVPDGGWFGVYGYRIYNPCGITYITASGFKYRKTGGVSWPAFAMEKSADGLSYLNVWSEAAPSANDAWQALASHASVNLGGTFYYCQIVNNTPNESVYQYYWHEFADVTLTLDKTPSITVAAETSNFSLNALLENAATGFSMTIELSLDLGTTLTVNTKEKTITLFDGTNKISALIDMPIRSEWFPLLPSQDNDITITQDGQVEFVFRLEDRSL